MASRLAKIPTRGFEPRAVSKPVKEPKQKEPQDEYTSIPISLIEIESNIRSEYDDEEIKNLANSMEKYGQLEPVSVYEKGDKYVIIFGHRRYLAAKLAKFKELKCIVKDKPDTLDKLYIQAIENEQAVNLSSSDREKYVKKLKNEYKQSAHEIADKLGKSDSWVYQALNAVKVREIHEDTFNKAGIPMTTKDTILINNATKEEVEAAIDLITNNPGSKTKVLKNLNEEKIIKKGSRTVNIENKPNTFVEPNQSDNKNYNLFKNVEIKIAVSKDENNKKVKIKTSSQGDFNDSIFQTELSELIENTKSRYKEEGYSLLE